MTQGWEELRKFVWWTLVIACDDMPCIGASSLVSFFFADQWFDASGASRVSAQTRYEDIKSDFHSYISEILDALVHTFPFMQPKRHA
jgi:hypothetical protein